MKPVFRLISCAVIAAALALLVGPGLAAASEDSSSAWPTGEGAFARATHFTPSAIRTGPARSVGRQGVVEGRVLASRSGSPLRGVRVFVSGTPQLEAISDQNGNFTLSNVPAGEVVIRTQLLGYTDAQLTVVVTSGATVNVTLELVEQAIGLDEILVSVDAREVRRAEFGTDIERVDAEVAVGQAAVANFSDLLNARAAGVTVTAASGSVGTASTIRVRGQTSLTQDNNPIMYVDGVRVSNDTGGGPGSFDYPDGQTTSRLNDINPNDISSIQVMKGPTAAALYGSEAAAGVIIIETKRGLSGQHQFTVSNEFGISTDNSPYYDNYFNLTHAIGLRDVDDPVYTQFRLDQNPVTRDVYARHNPMTDPLTSPLRTGISNATTLSLRGGLDDVTYFTSLSYGTEEGTLPSNSLNRLSMRGNIQVRPSERIQLALNTNFIRSETQLPDNDRSGVGFVTNAGAGLPLFSYGRRADGSRGDCLATLVSDSPSSVCDANQGNLTANFDKLGSVTNKEDLGRFIGSFSAHWTPASWLTNRLVFGIDWVQRQNMNLIPLDPDRPFGSTSQGLILDRRHTDQQISVDWAATATRDLSERLTASTTIGAQYFNSTNELVGCTGEGGFASTTAIACDAALTFSGHSNFEENVEIGALVQQRFGLNRYLYATGGLRIDDNSAFGANQSAIISPSLDASAVLSEMPFWSVDWMNNLRLRFAWGTAAQAPAPFAAATTFRPVRLEQGGSQQTGISPFAPGNPDLTAERNEEIELGFDAGMLENRVTLKFTYYNQTIRDAIVQTNVAPSTGFSAAQFVNIGAVTNKGMELVIGGELLDRPDIEWSADLKLSTQDPIVTSLGGEPPVQGGGNFGMFHVGYAPGAHYGPVIESAERDSDGNIVPGSVVFAPGNLPDIGGSQRFLGNANPTNEQNLSTQLVLFGTLRVFTLFDRAAGHKKNDTSGSFRNPFIPEISGDRIYAFRQAESTPEEQAALELSGANTRWMFAQDASFVKWREFTMSYPIPDRIVSMIAGGVASADITIGGRNLYTWTSYGGLDPEVSSGGGRDYFRTSEFYTQPPVRAFFGRISVTF